MARLVAVERAVLGHRRTVLDPGSDLERDARAFLDLVDRDHLGVLESGSTAHVSATDSAGGACSVTVSSGYGAGMIARGTGIWLNNCLGEQELNPHGLHRLTPGSRLLSNMAPTVARHERRDGAGHRLTGRRPDHHRDRPGAGRLRERRDVAGRGRAPPAGARAPGRAPPTRW